MIITRADIIRRLREHDRALLLREVAPVKSIEGLQTTLAVLRELERHHLVSINPQTDRWRYCGPEIKS